MLLSICGFCELGTEKAAVLVRLGLKLNLFIMYQVHTPTNALFIKLDNILKSTLKITLACSYMFRSTTIIREPSLELS